MINTSRELDPDVPSPAQFDHVITAVPQGNGYLWLDTTPEVAPFAYLLSPLRNKPALVIASDKPAVLQTTPNEPPSKSSDTFHIEAKLADNGTLEGKVERSITGDDREVLLRMAFRQMPMTQWKDLVQRISYMSGFSGEVSDVTVSPPEKTDEPFRISYRYKRKDFPQWSENRIATALPPAVLPPAPEEKPARPIFIGAVGEAQYDSVLELPKGYTPQLPKKIDLTEKFAEYHMSYATKGAALLTSRKIVVKDREIVPDDYDAYKKFSKAVAEDYQVYVGLMPRHVAFADYQQAVWTLPDSDNPEANRKYEEARNFNGRDTDGEIAALKKAVEVDPKFTRAWLWMGALYAYESKPDLTLEALRSAIANDPQQTLSYKGLGFALMGMRKFEEAISVWQQLMKVAPNDSDGPQNLGSTLFALKRYGEAAEAVETAVELSPERADLYEQLGTAYLQSGNDEKAVLDYKKALEMDPIPLMYNDIGYNLADKNKQLPLALEYVEKAVREEEEASARIKFSNLTDEDLRHTSSLGAYWDSLGWAQFRLGNLEQAEKYLDAAWQLSQSGVIGDHLGQVYEQEKKKQPAIRVYRLALAASRDPNQMKDTDTRLKKLGGRVEGPGAAELSEMRTTKITGLNSAAGSAEFFLVFTVGPKVEDVKFVNGSEKLKSADKALSSTAFKVPFPDDGPTKLVRRGILNCSAISGCNFVFYAPDSVQSVN